MFHQYTHKKIFTLHYHYKPHIIIIHFIDALMGIAFWLPFQKLPEIKSALHQSFRRHKPEQHCSINTSIAQKYYIRLVEKN